MATSKTATEDIYSELGRAYYRLSLARQLADEAKLASVESDIQELIVELLRVRHSLYTRPTLLAKQTRLPIG